MEASAPVRVDLGGTLDISTLHYPLRHLQPETFNAAIGLRTAVWLRPFSDGKIKVSSRGFSEAVFEPGRAPFKHPLGLMFAVACYFGVTGLHIDIMSASPPKSALGGSSSAAVALVSAYGHLMQAERGHVPFGRDQAALLAHHIEAGVAGVPCGLQDQLAAAYGGIHAWAWQADPAGPGFIRKPLLTGEGHPWFEQRVLLAYCGMPHESRDVNSRWIAQFLEARTRPEWCEIVDCTRGFIDAMEQGDSDAAVRWMNRENHIRQKMTADVLDALGSRLCKAAVAAQCGARFTGAGGGGCVWAMGRTQNIHTLEATWAEQVKTVDSAQLLDVVIDKQGVVVNNELLI